MPADMPDVGEFLTELPTIPEGEFAVYGTVYAYPEHADDLERRYAESTRMAADEPGTIYYCICRDDKDRSIFHFFERYTGRKGFEEHTSHPFMQKLVGDNLMRGVKARFAEPIRPARQ